MDMLGVQFLGALKSRMSWLGDRQKIVAENVANASTPGFKPHDLKPQEFSAGNGRGPGSIAPVNMMATSPMHLQAQTMANNSNAVVSPDSETTMDGNAVVLEEQMVKMAESRMQFEAAVAFYQKSMGMLKMASRKPGG